MTEEQKREELAGHPDLDQMARDFCDGAFKPFGISDVSLGKYVEIIRELLENAILRSPRTLPGEEEIAKAICCPGGCLRAAEDITPADCWAKKSVRPEAVKAVLALISNPGGGEVDCSAVIEECAKLVEQPTFSGFGVHVDIAVIRLLGRRAAAIRALACAKRDRSAAELTRLRAELDEAHHEQELFAADAADRGRMVDRIADLIGLPHDEELSQTNFERWFDRIGDAALRAHDAGSQKE